jgi:hypothetical protein
MLYTPVSSSVVPVKCGCGYLQAPDPEVRLEKSRLLYVV